MLSITRTKSTSQPPDPEGGPVLDEQYTVLLLNESQLDRFLRRPSMRHLGRRSSGTVNVSPLARNRRGWTAGGIVAALGVWAIVWLRASAGDPAVVPTPPPAVLAPTVPTGASFSVTVASFVKDADARSLASRLEALGLPAFAWRVEGTRRQVMLGPYVAIDEAEAAQRTLASHGYRGTRVFVDDRLRGQTVPPQVGESSAPGGLAKASLPAVLVAAPGRLALAFELPGEPRHASGRRVSGTLFDVEAGPMATPIGTQEWSAPLDIQLVRRIAVAPAAGAAPGLRVRLTLSETATATLRVSGRRVYVDVTRGQPDFQASPVPAAPVAKAAPAAPAPAPRDPGESALPAVPTADSYLEAIGPVVARFEELQPFLRSAVTSPSPDVLTALGGTVAQLEASMPAAVPPDALAPHGLLSSALQLAREAVSPGFAGDRAAQIREAAAQFAAAKSRLH